MTGGLTYDAGALIAAERDQDRMWAIHRRALARGVTPVVPAGVLAEVYRSGRQVNLARLLRACDVESLDEDAAKTAGALHPAAKPGGRVAAGGSSRIKARLRQ